LGAKYEDLRFWDAYSVAEDIRIAIEENPEDELFCEYFLPSREEINRILKSPSKWTLLHQFIQDRYWESRILGFEHENNDALDLVVYEYLIILDGYEIDHDIYVSEVDEDIMNDAVNKLRELIPVRRIVHETFQLLFSDRGFLTEFNKLVAETVKSLEKIEYPDLLKKNGVLYRKTLPKWTQRGVFYRDRGRCIQCYKDLSGVMVSGEEVHYDHIVPLAVGGTNDPSNFQLLCCKCNLAKSVKTFSTDKYPVYWSLE
jgi:HNH endonuclease